MSCNCGNNCKNCERVVITKQGERGFQGPPGPQGPKGETGATGQTGASGIDLYDSNWITLNDYDIAKGYGLPAYVGGWVHPKIRVIGKQVFLSGRILLPLASDGGGTVFIPEENTYPTASKAYVRLYEGADGGFTTNPNGSAESTSPILPSILRPTDDHIIDLMKMSYRPIKDESDTASLVLSTVLPNITFRTTGKLYFSTHKDLDDSALGGGAGSINPDSPVHQLISKIATGDTAPDYTAYKTTYTVGVDQRLSPDSLLVYPAEFDGENERHLGGFVINFTFSYPITIAATQTQIEAAIAEIQA